MNARLRFLASLVILAAVTTIAGQQSPPQEPQPQQQPPQQQPPAEQPRFRGGANLVRVDAYVTADGVPVKDLSAADFEVLEDGVPQRIESFQLVQPRSRGPANTLREPNTVAESREMAADPDVRVFVLFLDVWHVQVDGSYRAREPITRLLDRVIAQDDMFGVMTPDMSARDLTFARRAETIAGILKNHWTWGERDSIVTSDPREQELAQCYPDRGQTAGMAAEMIRRRRAERTLRAIEELIIHLEGVREERKFVFLLTEGWLLNGPDPQLARPLKTEGGDAIVPPPPAIGVDPGGRLRMDPTRGDGSMGSCERERAMLAHTDQAYDFDQLVQRANRANVSFYPVDARGLVVFDEPMGPRRPPPPSVDAARLRSRQDTLRTLADNTDGYAIINTNAIDKALERVVQDTGAYYLLGYYSTNTKLDGRFRRLTVRVKRKETEVRARPGYLAPTEAELASTRVTALMNGARPGYTTIPVTISAALDRLAPARGNVPLRLQTSGAPGRVWVTGEIDAAMLKTAEWQQGGRARITLQHERGAAAPVQREQVLAPGQSAFTITSPADVSLAAGRYVVRVELLASAASVPLQTTADVNVPDQARLVSATGLALRRGPATGLAYVATADPRYRRTERIRLEVPRAAGESTVSARLLGRDGQALNVGIVLSERTDDASQQRLTVADLMLAPLAQGEYVLEIAVAQGDRKDTATYAFRLVP
jgi:VWFA-related protein